MTLGQKMGFSLTVERGRSKSDNIGRSCGLTLCLAFVRVIPTCWISVCIRVERHRRKPELIACCAFGDRAKSLAATWTFSRPDPPFNCAQSERTFRHMCETPLDLLRSSYIRNSTGFLVALAPPLSLRIARNGKRRLTHFLLEGLS